MSSQELINLAIASVVEYSAGFVSGLVVDSIFPSPIESNKAASQELIEVGTQVAIDGVLIAKFGSYLSRTVNPENLTGGGLFFLGLVSSQSNFNIKAQRLSSRIKLSLLDLVDEELAVAARVEKESKK